MLTTTDGPQPRSLGHLLWLVLKDSPKPHSLTGKVFQGWLDLGHVIHVLREYGTKLAYCLELA